MKTLFFLLTASCLLFAGTAQAANPFDIVINEIAWMGSLPDEGETTRQAANDEWIELYNPTTNAVNINGWTLKSSDEKPTIELSSNIEAGSYLLLSRANETVAGITADIVYAYKNNALSNSGEYLQLFDNEGNLIDEINASDGWPAGDNDTKQTMERTPQSGSAATGQENPNWRTSLSAGGTPGAQNSIYESAQSTPPDPEPDPAPDQSPPADEPDQQVNEPPEETGAATTTNNGEETPQPITYPDNIFINEIMPYPEGPDAENEWVEIINENNKRVDISLWQIQDTSGAISTYTFPEGTSIAINTFLVISRPTSKITLNNDGDGLKLIRPDGEIVQIVQFGKAPKGKACFRNGEAWQWSDVPTPGSMNIVSRISTSPPRTSSSDATKKKQINTDKEQTSTDTQTYESAGISQKSVGISGNDLASIGSSVELGANDKNSNLVIYFLAPLLAIFSAIFIFLLKKRLRSFP